LAGVLDDREGQGDIVNNRIASKLGVSIVALLAGSLLLSACGGAVSSAKPASARPSSVAARTTAETRSAHGGTVTWAEIAGGAPNYIFPLDPSAYFTPGNMAQFQDLLYEPLYEPSETSPKIDDAISIGNTPVWSDGDRVVTITLKHYVWTNGTPVTARDITFCINLLRAVGAEWAGYTPTGFPLNLKKVTIDNPYKLTFTLIHPYNPTYFDDGQLFDIIPLPQNVWDRESLKGRVANFDESVAGAKKVWNFLNSYSTDQGTYSDSNPIWGVTDGPFRLQSFGRDAGPDVFVPNRTYSGHRATIAKFEELPFTSDFSEYNELRSGNGALTVGYVPASDAKTLGVVRSAGYSVTPVPQWGIEYFLVNLKNPVLGAAFAQLYLRQALQHLVNEPLMIKEFLHGYGVPTYGPAPVLPKGNPFVDSAEMKNPYPFSIADAARLLRSHGWKKINGIATCEDPAKCGHGVKKGTELIIHLLDPSGTISITDEAEYFGSAANEVGIRIVLKEEAYGNVLAIVNPCTPGQDGVTLSSPLCTWQMANYEGWDYNSVYPTAGEFLLPGADGNAGSFVSPSITAAIYAIRVAKSFAAYHHYESLVAHQLPFIWQPVASELVAVSKNLRGSRITGEFDDVSPLTPNFWRLAASS